VALDGVDLGVRAGEICAVVGPNGAGKTTLFRIIVGLTTPTSGSGTVLGLDVERESERIRRLVGWMSAEDRTLLMRTTCKENLYLHGRLQGMTRRQLAPAIPRILETVGLGRQHDSIVAALSSGMKARLRLARALLPSPRVLLLDEPTGAVDPVAAHAILNLITDLVREQSLAVLLSSHRLEEIEALQSYAVLLDRGKVRYSGDLDDLRRTWERPSLELVLASEAAAVRLAADLVAAGVDTIVDATTVRCRLSADASVGELLAGFGSHIRDIRGIREVPMPLRELIARVYAPEHQHRSNV
jgi:ABC-2 type transport system ATP-binding protein